MFAAIARARPQPSTRCSPPVPPLRLLLLPTRRAAWRVLTEWWMQAITVLAQVQARVQMQEPVMTALACAAVLMVLGLSWRLSWREGQASAA